MSQQHSLPVFLSFLAQSSVEKKPLWWPPTALKIVRISLHFFFFTPEVQKPGNEKQQAYLLEVGQPCCQHEGIRLKQMREEVHWQLGAVGHHHLVTTVQATVTWPTSVTDGGTSTNKQKGKKNVKEHNQTIIHETGMRYSDFTYHIHLNTHCLQSFWGIYRATLNGNCSMQVWTLYFLLAEAAATFNSNSSPTFFWVKIHVWPHVLCNINTFSPCWHIHKPQQ